ncbi:hypothetical protein ETH_00033455 [Eimeria tenella]|uniref:Uncharacterized protein n=1 Tax=Eimeria tenella TaxID=5802 RepID=U6L4S7_EIMTE|nr:hypothetical protein ETH_00033455 [Eimeria tenella]CDJ45156.1 hypothetical protein ETH_00033455 [Eimeria tenella]|eukprot:XP_013235903.1 hypothetical protein ETH_00033455 [Eimeria tenella]
MLAALADALDSPAAAAACRSWGGWLSCGPQKQQQQQQQQTLQQLLLQLWLAEQQRFGCISTSGEIKDLNRPLLLQCLSTLGPQQQTLDIRRVCRPPAEDSEDYSEGAAKPWEVQLPEGLMAMRAAARRQSDDLRFELFVCLRKLDAAAATANEGTGAAAAAAAADDSEELTAAAAQQQIFIRAGEILWRLDALTETKDALAGTQLAS